jgi:chemotaxis methyl-accepting protein methylase
VPLEHVGDMKIALAATEIECFRTLVTQRFGLYFGEPRLDFLADVVRQRMEATGCVHFSSYQRRIASSAGEPDELRALAERLTVNETYFLNMRTTCARSRRSSFQR